MAKWKLVSKHEYEFIAAFLRYAMTLGGLLAGLLMAAGLRPGIRQHTGAFRVLILTVGQCPSTSIRNP
jgi:hypothetical protein